MADVSLTREEQKLLKGKKDDAIKLLTNKAILDRAEKEYYTEVEKKELDYLYNSEKVKLYISQYVMPKINVSENEIIELYNENKDFFDNKGMQFSEAREILYADIHDQKVVQLEDEYVEEIVASSQDIVTVTKEEIQMSRGNADVIKTLVINKVILDDIKNNSLFEKDEEKTLKQIKDNILLNYFVEKYVRDKMEVTDEEIEEIYNSDKELYENMKKSDALNEIRENLYENKETKIQLELVQEMARKYRVLEEIEKYEF